MCVCVCVSVTLCDFRRSRVVTMWDKSDKYQGHWRIYRGPEPAPPPFGRRTDAVTLLLIVKTVLSVLWRVLNFDHSAVKHALQNTQNNCHQWLSHSCIVHQIHLQRSPRPLAGLVGPTSKGKGGEEKVEQGKRGKGGKRREREGEGRGGSCLLYTSDAADE